MPQRFNLPILQVFDSAGAPMAGAKLNFYQTGTTTPLNTYNDADLTVANANPVVADANGRFDDIFLQNQDYRVTLTDADDNTIWTADPVRSIDRVGKQTVSIPATAMRPTQSNGCAELAYVETTAGRPDLMVLDFDQTTDEFAQFSIPFPKGWNEGTITYRAFWTHAGGQTAGLDGVAWMLQGVAVSDGDTIDVAYGTAVTVAGDGSTTAEVLNVTAESAAITIGGTPQEGDICFFRIGRDPDHASDDMDQDARLVAVQLFYNIDEGTDD